MSSEQAPELADRTTRARIRDAAIRCYAEHGVAGTTARRVAAAAGVSPGSVINHFETMEGLRRACDEHVLATIRRRKLESIAAGPNLDLMAALRDAETEFSPVLAYLARVLVDDSPAVVELVDVLAADAEEQLQQGTEAGMIRPLDDRSGVAAVLTIWSLGALVLHSHLDRLLGVDLTDPDAASGHGLAQYAGPAYELLARGIFTEEFARRALDALSHTRPEMEADDGQ